MKELNCNRKAHGDCPLALTIKVLLLVVVAEIAIYTYALISGASDVSGQLLNSLVRVIIIAIGVYLFLGRSSKLQEIEESENSEAVVVSPDDAEINPLPNIDALTRTSNERGLTISILELMALADRYGHKLSIGMIKADGIDKLEKSDVDDAMINMAGLMTESLRLPDRIGRFKDDVFMVLLPESDIKGAAIVADRLRENINRGTKIGDAEGLSVCIGMTEFQRGEDLQSLLERVDAALIQSEIEDSGVCIKQA